MDLSMEGVRGRLKAAHAAHGRSEGNRLPPAPLSPKTWDAAPPGPYRYNPGTCESSAALSGQRAGGSFLVLVGE
ncbi:hypothetical protein [Candidatus Methylacidithermus pantelleriae]|uniref:hypothetical protein n=1 Tax=Candidatus Methylacidithermus pantelleriae TaxID=2744239 RepID=UPI001BD538D5|nr:hypothetical protein [Candidatus Methylacidithermus pantelleriae]